MQERNTKGITFGSKQIVRLEQNICRRYAGAECRAYAMGQYIQEDWRVCSVGQQKIYTNKGCRGYDKGDYV